MKKTAVFIAVLLVVRMSVCIAEGIDADFYLGDAKNGKKRALPNTLCAILTVGESAELFAESYPDGKGSFAWAAERGNGVVTLFPEGARCTVVANAEGEENIMIHLRGGESAKIFVRVKPAPIVHERSFEAPENDDLRKELPAKILKAVLYLLSFGGTGLVLFSVIIFLRRKK